MNAWHGFSTRVLWSNNARVENPCHKTSQILTMTHQRFHPRTQDIGVHRCSLAPTANRQLPTANCLPPRRGNVLILVVVLLVLLALAGTAYLSVVRIDRTSTAVSSDITQADMLLDSAQALVEQRLIDDLNGSSRWDHPNSDKWLADRVPLWMGDALTGFPVWRFASDIAEQSGLAYRFDSPFAMGYPPVTGPKRNYRLQPGVDAGTGLPAIAILDGTGADLGFGIQPAADADGDGIADSPYMHFGRIGDETYYIGVRVIDNAAAINVNTAFDRDFDYGPGGYADLRRNYGMFTSNIGLRQLLTDYNPATGASVEGFNPNRFRFGYPEQGAGSSNSLLPGDNVPLTDMSVAPLPVDPAAPRDDLHFDTQGEALWTQVGRRVDNPGYRATDARFRSYPISEMTGFAYRFVLKDTSGPLYTLLETGGWAIPSSVVAPEVRTTPYGPGDVNGWFFDNFDYYNVSSDVSWTRRHVRPLLVTHNPVSNLAPIHTDRETGNIPWSIYNFDNTLVYPTVGPTTRVRPIARTSINTATFGELWRAFWAVMHRNSTNIDPNTQVPPEGIDRMFRGAHTGLTPYEQLQLRAAIAAVNAEDLRDYDDDVTERIIRIGTGATEKEISIFGTEKQVFISEVVVHLDGATGTVDDYVAIELYSPYFDPGDSPAVPAPAEINLNNWQLAAYDRAAGTFTHIHSFTSDDAVPSRGFLVVESGSVPPGITAPTDGVPAPLINALGRELVLLRPRRATGIPSGPEPTATPGDSDMRYYVPVDQIDLSDLSAEPSNPAGDTPVTRRYARLAPDDAAGATADAWNCVYPGSSPLATDLDDRGFEDENGESTLGAANTGDTIDESFTIPLNDYGWPGPRHSPFAPALSSPQQRASFPYGGFARNGDILMTPFIGAHIVREVAASPGEGRVLAMNSVTLDAAYAEEADPTNDGRHLGRFSPLRHQGAATTEADGYAWTRSIFDHLTAHQNPDGDYLPNISPESYVLGQEGSGYTAPIADSDFMPQPTPNGPVSTVAAANQGHERGVGTHGLININTAPPYVLNMLPLAQAMDPGSTPDFSGHELVNRDIAHAIWEAAGTSAFQSPFDLLRRVGEVARYGTVVNPAPGVDLDEYYGDVTPYEFASPAGDGVLDDFEQHYMPLTRLSNLITTRSDSFTVYIVLEGWRNAGTPDAERITQRRRAFIVDRSGYTPTNPRLSITPVPMD